MWGRGDRGSDPGQLAKSAVSSIYFPSLCFLRKTCVVFIDGRSKASVPNNGAIAGVRLLSADLKERKRERERGRSHQNLVRR